MRMITKCLIGQVFDTTFKAQKSAIHSSRDKQILLLAKKLFVVTCQMGK